MTELKKMSFEEARAIAEKKAIERVGIFLADQVGPVLDDYYIRGENFWIFFASENVKLPPESWELRQFPAYGVSDYNFIGYFRDFREQPEELTKALKGLPKRVEEYRVRKQKELDEAEASKHKN